MILSLSPPEANYPNRIIGSEFEQPIIAVFPYPTVTLNGFGVERYLEYTVSH